MDSGGRHRSSGRRTFFRGGGRGRRGLRWLPRNPNPPTPARPDSYCNESLLGNKKGESYGLRGTSQVKSPKFVKQQWLGDDDGSLGVSDDSSFGSGNPHSMGEPLQHGRLDNTSTNFENASLGRAEISDEGFTRSKGSQWGNSTNGPNDVRSLELDESFTKSISEDEDQVLAGDGSATALHHNTVSGGVHAEKQITNEISPSICTRYQYDICPPKTGTPFALKPSLLEKNREMRNIVKRSMERRKGMVLRSGMVLLKNYLSIAEQVKIAKTCRMLGMGNGGFYQPGYRDGAKLNLHMMCLGKNWDPEERNYVSIRSIDGAKPPAIPQDFVQFVKKAMRLAHEAISEESGVRNVENILPNVLPDICLVNFYSTSGKLGMHQDRDESPESLDEGIPVVSFSIGDSAEFLYGDQRDVEKAGKVVLESGDVLIFGGKSRHVFHGVSSVIPNSASKMLVDETNLRPVHTSSGSMSRVDACSVEFINSVFVHAVKLWFKK